jgi:hypothetical protein
MGVMGSARADESESRRCLDLEINLMVGGAHAGGLGAANRGQASPSCIAGSGGSGETGRWKFCTEHGARHDGDGCRTPMGMPGVGSRRGLV